LEIGEKPRGTTLLYYNNEVDSRTGRSLLPRERWIPPGCAGSGEESPNSTEQCAG